MKGKEVKIYVMGYKKEKLYLKPKVWISACSIPFKGKNDINKINPQ